MCFDLDQRCRALCETCVFHTSLRGCVNRDLHDLMLFSRILTNRHPRKPHCTFFLACSAGVFFERAIRSRKRHVETSRREEEMGRVNRKGYYLYSPQSSTVIKSKIAATTILRTRTRFRPPKIRLHCRLLFSFLFFSLEK